MHRRWWILATVMLGTFMAPLDASVVNVALPDISRSFHTGVDATEWVLLAYMLVTSSTLILFGRLGDMIGQRTVYLIGFVVFGLASAACAFAPSLAVLVFARILQGLGASMLMSSSPAIITNAFPARERGRAIGTNGAAVAVALAVGPALGGVIVTYAHWPWIFLINVPISIAALAMAARILEPEERKSARFDFVGAAVGGAAIFALALALARSHVWGWGSPLTLGCIAAGGILAYAFYRLERGMQAPLLDFTLFENKTFLFSVVAAVFYFCASYALFFTIPLVAQQELHESGLRAGLLLTPIFALNVVLAPLAGHLSDRIPARYISTVGAVVLAVGLVLLGFMPDHPSLLLLVGVLALSGTGTAVFTQPNNSTIMGSAPQRRRGVAAGVLATARTTGQLFGVAVASAIYFARVAQLGAAAHSFAPAKPVFIAGAAIMVGVAAISFARGR